MGFSRKKGEERGRWVVYGERGEQAKPAHTQNVGGKRARLRKHSRERE